MKKWLVPVIIAASILSIMVGVLIIYGIDQAYFDIQQIDGQLPYLNHLMIPIPLQHI